jgi:recombinational DNA repair ATPase RecF
LAEVDLTARNIGGIDETEATLSPGVTALTGHNATNRTSLLQAIMVTLGSD